MSFYFWQTVVGIVLPLCHYAYIHTIYIHSFMWQEILNFYEHWYHTIKRIVKHSTKQCYAIIIIIYILIYLF